MEIKDIYGNVCPTLYALSLVSGKWRLPILWKLSEHQTLRFNGKRSIIRADLQVIYLSA